VRRALGLDKRDKIQYSIRPGGEVVLTRVDTLAPDDPVLGQFLVFLAQDLATHPEQLKAIDSDLLEHLNALTLGLEVDLSATLSAEDE
jgi:antitoxin PrlF